MDQMLEADMVGWYAVADQFYHYEVFFLKLCYEHLFCLMDNICCLSRWETG